MQRIQVTKPGANTEIPSQNAVESWNGIIIHPDIYGENPTDSLAGLRSHLDYCEVTFEDDGDVDKNCLKDLIDAPNGSRIISFYDRHDNICDWYYAAYASTDHSTAPVNTVASEILQRSIRGRVLVILDGPKDGKWMKNTMIAIDELARTLWWYRQSGSDLAEVFGERELRRFVSTLYD